MGPMLAENDRSTRRIAAVTACAAMTVLVLWRNGPAERLDLKHTAKARMMSVERVPTSPAPPPVAALPVVLAAKPAAPTPVTHELLARARSLLIGCWQGTYDRWTFRSDGKLGLVVVRDPAFNGYVERAKIPRPVMYDPTKGSFAFAAAGRIHGLLMIFEIKHDTLEASVFTSHDGKGYYWTGNNMTLTPCAAQPIRRADP